MLKLELHGGANRNCDGTTRRNFLQIGTLGMLGLALPDLLRFRAAAAESGTPSRSNKSVVMLWLGGGPTHVETFDPKMTAPVEFRSTTGAIRTSVPGIEIGSTFPRMARHAHQMAFVRSFEHRNSGHSGGTHWVMTGRDHPPADNGAPQIWPSLGAMAARYHGASTPNHLPTYSSISGIYGDGAAWLGQGYNPFTTSGQARDNMTLRISPERLADRGTLLRAFDTMRNDVDRTGMMNAQDQFVARAYNILTGSVARAFDTSRQDPRLIDRYGRTPIGQQLLLAAQLAENGVRFSTIHYGGWDMHGNIEQGMKQISPPLDQAVAAFLEHMESSGLLDDTLLVITGEFGRTPRINGSAGRDHWAPLSTLAFAGGGLRMGQVIGESNARAEVPHTRAISPSDLAATVFHVLGMPTNLQYHDQSGRPQNLVEGRVISELV